MVYFLLRFDFAGIDFLLWLYIIVEKTVAW